VHLQDSDKEEDQTQMGQKMPRVYFFVSTGVLANLQDDIFARAIISVTYFFWDKNRPPEWRVTAIPKK